MEFHKKRKELVEQFIPFMFDSALLFLWVVAQWVLSLGIAFFELPQISQIMLTIYQVIFGIGTLAFIVNMIYSDVMKFIDKEQHKRELQHIELEAAKLENLDKVLTRLGSLKMEADELQAFHEQRLAEYEKIFEESVAKLDEIRKEVLEVLTSSEETGLEDVRKKMLAELEPPPEEKQDNAGSFEEEERQKDKGSRTTEGGDR